MRTATLKCLSHQGARTVGERDTQNTNSPILGCWVSVTSNLLSRPIRMPDLQIGSVRTRRLGAWAIPLDVDNRPVRAKKHQRVTTAWRDAGRPVVTHVPLKHSRNKQRLDDLRPEQMDVTIVRKEMGFVDGCESDDQTQKRDDFSKNGFQGLLSFALE
jgi:hypothetical protein